MSYSIDNTCEEFASKLNFSQDDIDNMISHPRNKEISLEVRIKEHEKKLDFSIDIDKSFVIEFNFNNFNTINDNQKLLIINRLYNEWSPNFIIINNNNISLYYEKVVNTKNTFLYNGRIQKLSSLIPSDIKLFMNKNDINIEFSIKINTITYDDLFELINNDNIYIYKKLIIQSVLTLDDFIGKQITTFIQKKIDNKEIIYRKKLFFIKLNKNFNQFDILHNQLKFNNNIIKYDDVELNNIAVVDNFEFSIKEFNHTISDKFDLQIKNNEYYIVRLDGKKFSNLTKLFNKTDKLPFDINFISMMVLTLKDVVEQFKPSTGYCHSDEITLIFPKCENHLFDGNMNKLIFNISMFTTLRFNYHFMNIINKFVNQYKKYNELVELRPIFDARIMKFTDVDKYEIYNHQIMRSIIDSERNALLTYGCLNFKQSGIDKKNTLEIKEMLKEKNINWNTDIDLFLKNGVYCKLIDNKVVIFQHKIHNLLDKNGNKITDLDIIKQNNINNFNLLISDFIDIVDPDNFIDINNIKFKNII